MKRISNQTIVEQTFDEERAFYDCHHISIKKCAFDGPADGESAFKECSDITVEDTFLNLRYPFWHTNILTITQCNLTELCRAALWYSTEIQIRNTDLHGIKALRECFQVTIEDCDIISPEFGWSSNTVTMKNTHAESEYFMMRSQNLVFDHVDFKGKYSFQYVENASFTNCVFDTKDAFWHGKNITVTDSIVKGEYLAWYSDGLTLIRCKIIGTQPFCYCKNLTLIDCEMLDTDLAFEKSDVNATILTAVESIKNPHTGKITAPKVHALILDEPTNCELQIAQIDQQISDQ